MSIHFNYTIIHSIDRAYPIPTLSEGPLVLNDEIEYYLTKHLYHILEGTTTRKTDFGETGRGAMLIPLALEKKYYEVSSALANWFFESLEEVSTISSGDIIISFVTIDEVDKLVILKCNYKEAFTHHVEHEGNGFIHTMKKETAIFPGGEKKLEEAIIVDIATKEVWLVDESKGKYISDMLGCGTVLSIKEKLQVVEQVVKETIEEHYANPVEAYSIAKSNIKENIYQTSSIPVKKLMEETFGEDETVFEQCMEKIEAFGMEEDIIEATNKAVGKKYTTHKLKTSNGIELKMPTELMQNKDFVEIIQQPDGTTSILLKNIGEITHK